MAAIKTISLAFTILLLSSLSSSPQKKSALDLTNQVFKITKAITALEYVMKRKERVNGELSESYSYTKLIKKPKLKVYFKQGLPDSDGLEALLIDGENENKAIINPNGFPWFNFWLNPYGNIMRNNQHHTLYDSGFDKVISILEHLINKYEDDIPNLMSVSYDEMYNNIPCFKVTFDNSYYKHIDYTVKNDETVVDIAKKLMVCGYIILQMNDLDDYKDIDEGQVLNVPNDYAKKLELLIEKERMIPIVLSVYDNEGLFEEYEYQELKVNPEFEDDEFTTEYSEYGF
ncbi:MAG: DUF1571 domain-containing protein [Bacteroidia bacterium]|nr:DUF1571 domain-containing protein [Bacteroidia bacterium]